MKHRSFNTQIDQAEERLSEIEDLWMKESKKARLEKKEWKEMNKACKKYGIMWKDQSTFAQCTWKWQGEWNQVRKHSSGYYPGELPKPSKAVQHSNPRNTEKSTKIFLKKSNPKHISIRFTRVEMKEKMLRTARERKVRSPTEVSQSDSQQICWQKPYKVEESGGQYSTSLKKRTFNPESHIQPN